MLEWIIDENEVSQPKGGMIYETTAYSTSPGNEGGGH